MNKYEFIKYNSDAKSYGIDESVANTIVNMFVDFLQKLIILGQSVEINEISEFKTTALFPKDINHQNNTCTNIRLSKRNMVSFTASK